MRTLICAFVVRIWHKQFFSRCGSSIIIFYYFISTNEQFCGTVWAMVCFPFLNTRPKQCSVWNPPGIHILWANHVCTMGNFMIRRVCLVQHQHLVECSILAQLQRFIFQICQEQYFWHMINFCMSSKLPYNGIFSRRQIFAVLSKNHGDYFSRILIFAVGNVREK